MTQSKKMARIAYDALNEKKGTRCWSPIISLTSRTSSSSIGASMNAMLFFTFWRRLFKRRIL